MARRWHGAARGHGRAAPPCATCGSMRSIIDHLVATGADRADPEMVDQLASIADQLDDWPSGTLYEGLRQAANAPVPTPMPCSSSARSSVGPTRWPRRSSCRVDAHLEGQVSAPGRPKALRVHGGYIAGPSTGCSAPPSRCRCSGHDGAADSQLPQPDSAAHYLIMRASSLPWRAGRSSPTAGSTRPRPTARSVVRRGRGTVHLDGLRPLRRHEGAAGRQERDRLSGADPGAEVDLAQAALDELLLGCGVLLQTRHERLLGASAHQRRPNLELTFEAAGAAASRVDEDVDALAGEAVRVVVGQQAGGGAGPRGQTSSSTQLRRAGSMIANTADGGRRCSAGAG